MSHHKFIVDSTYGSYTAGFRKIFKDNTEKKGKVEFECQGFSQYLIDIFKLEVKVEPSSKVVAQIQLDIPGKIGDNETGISVVGFVKGENNYMTVFFQAPNFDKEPQRDPFVITTPRDFNKSNKLGDKIKIASYSGQTEIRVYSADVVQVGEQKRYESREELLSEIFGSDTIVKVAEYLRGLYY